MSIEDKVRDLAVRAQLTGSNASTPLQLVQAEVFDGELQDEIEHFEQYGVTSRPLEGAEVLLAHLDGDRTHPIAAVITDRRYRPVDLSRGEVCLFDNLGRKVYLSKDGIRVEGVDSPVTVTTSGNVTLTGAKIILDGEVTCTKNITAAGNINDQGGTYSMAGMRSTYNRHTHVHGSSSSETPTQKM